MYKQLLLHVQAKNLELATVESALGCGGLSNAEIAESISHADYIFMSRRNRRNTQKYNCKITQIKFLSHAEIAEIRRNIIAKSRR